MSEPTLSSSQSAQAEPSGHGWRVLGILSALMGFASISTDLYLPAMPAMAHALGADTGATEWTVSGYLIGFSLGQLAWGPIGDRFGRRAPVAAGVLLFALGSAGCAMAMSVWAVIGARIVQAIGAAAGVVLGRAMVRDLYSGPRAASMMSTLMTVMAVAPLVGPLVGGQILLLSGWRAIFWSLVAFGALTLAAIFTLPETLPANWRSDAPFLQVAGRYRGLLRDPRIMAYAGAVGFFYAGMFAYVAGSPFAYITYYRLPPQYYGLLFGLGVIGIMGTNLVNARLVHRYGIETMLLGGTALAVMAGVMVAFAAVTDLGGLAGLVAALFMFIAATGFIVANAIAGALDSHPEQAGAVSALVGAIQYGSGILGSALVGLFADGTPVPMGSVICLSGIGSLASVIWLRRHPAT